MDKNCSVGGINKYICLKEKSCSTSVLLCKPKENNNLCKNLKLQLLIIYIVIKG